MRMARPTGCLMHALFRSKRMHGASLAAEFCPIVPCSGWAWFYVGRAAGRDRDHRRARGAAVAGDSSQPRIGPAFAMSEQSAAIALAAVNFESAKRHSARGAAGVFCRVPVYRGSSLLVYLLPQLEEANIQQTWDFDDPGNNALGGATARTATVLPMLLCPSDLVIRPPVHAVSTD